MIGKPKYNYGDTVSCVLTDENGESFTVVGTIEIIDRWGTFEQDEEVSYDFMVNDWKDTGEPMFVKHVREDMLQKIG